MKKFVKLSLVAAALAVFALSSCSNSSDSSESASVTWPVPEETATVTELAFDAEQLNKKIFSCLDSEGYVTTYYLFNNGKCQKSPYPDLTGSQDATEVKYVALSAGKLRLCEGKWTRQSGSGLFATWTIGNKTLSLLKTGAANLTVDGKLHHYGFTNTNGLITMMKGRERIFGLYDGNNIHLVSYDLVFVNNYPY